MHWDRKLRSWRHTISNFKVNKIHCNLSILEPLLNWPQKSSSYNIRNIGWVFIVLRFNFGDPSSNPSDVYSLLGKLLFESIKLKYHILHNFIHCQACNTDIIFLMYFYETLGFVERTIHWNWNQCNLDPAKFMALKIDALFSLTCIQCDQMQVFLYNIWSFTLMKICPIGSKTNV